MNRRMVEVERLEIGPFYLDAQANRTRRRGKITGFAIFNRLVGNYFKGYEWQKVGGWLIESDGNNTWGPRVEDGRLYGIVEVADVDKDRESVLLTGGTLVGIIGDLEVALVSHLTRDYGSDLTVLNVNRGRMGYYIYDGVKRLGRVREWNLENVRRVLRS